MSLGFLSSFSAFVALLSFFGNSFCYLRVTVCRLPLLAFPACPSFSGLFFRRLLMAVQVIPVFLSFFGSYLRHLRVAVLCPSYPLCARRCCCACDNSCWLGLGGLWAVHQPLTAPHSVVLLRLHFRQGRLIAGILCRLAWFVHQRPAR